MRGGMPLYHNADATYSAPCSDQYRWRCRAVVVDVLHLYCFTRRSLLETIASYGTRFVVCDIRARHLQEALPSPSVLTPCDYRMLQSPAK